MEFEPPCGALLVTPRKAYMHYGIYAGHCRDCWMRAAPRAGFECSEIVARDRSRVGEDRYRALHHNCEHFCHGCLFGEPRDSCWRRWLACPRTTIELLHMRLLQFAGGSDPRDAPVLLPSAAAQLRPAVVGQQTLADRMMFRSRNCR